LKVKSFYTSLIPTSKSVFALSFNLKLLTYS
jgi:hypothetical protein